MAMYECKVENYSEYITAMYINYRLSFIIDLNQKWRDDWNRRCPPSVRGDVERGDLPNSITKITMKNKAKSRRRTTGAPKDVRDEKKISQLIFTLVQNRRCLDIKKTKRPGDSNDLQPYCCSAYLVHEFKLEIIHLMIIEDSQMVYFVCQIHYRNWAYTQSQKKSLQPPLST